MRYEAYHQNIKRRIETAGFKNILKTVPKTVIENRQECFKKLGILQKEKYFKDTYVMLKDSKEVYRVLNVEGSYLCRKINVIFDEVLLGYEITKDTQETEKTEFEEKDVCAKGTKCIFNEKNYVVFFDYLLQ